MQSTALSTIQPKPASDYRTEDGRRTIHRASGARVEYRGYHIVEKKDFGSTGYLLNGVMVRHGYVVTDGSIINEMPGATWFLTVESAMRAIDDLIASMDMRLGRGEHPFWRVNRFRREAEEHAPELALLLQAVVDGKSPEATLAAIEQAKALLDQIDNNCDMRARTRHPDGAVTRAGERQFGRFGIEP